MIIPTPATSNQNAITEPRPESLEPVTGSTAGEVVELMFEVVLGLDVDGDVVGVADDETIDVDPSV